MAAGTGRYYRGSKIARVPDAPGLYAWYYKPRLPDWSAISAQLVQLLDSDVRIETRATLRYGVQLRSAADASLHYPSEGGDVPAVVANLDELERATVMTFLMDDTFLSFARPLYIGIAKLLNRRVYSQHYSSLVSYWEDGHEVNRFMLAEPRASVERLTAALTVNRKAQTVSQARNLLLDDNDFAALMMRRTLSKFKGRTEDQDTLARIYSFRYSDSDDEGKAIQAGKLEYSSAVFLHKLHCIGSFGNPKGFTLEEPSDLSNGLNHRNSDRPAEMLIGTNLERWQKLSRQSAKSHAPADVDVAVEKLGGLVDHVMLALFDTFSPFAAHNRTMRQLRTRLSEPSMRADAIQNKVFSLLFEGSGSKEVFEEHIDRLAGVKREWTEEGRPVSDYVVNQLNDAIAVQKALQRHETDLKRQRACQLFNVRYDRFYPDPTAESAGDQQKLEHRSRSIFDARLDPGVPDRLSGGRPYSGGNGASRRRTLCVAPGASRGRHGSHADCLERVPAAGNCTPRDFRRAGGNGACLNLQPGLSGTARAPRPVGQRTQ